MASNLCSSELLTFSHLQLPLPVFSLQSAALREAAVFLNDAKQAQKLQRELQQRAALKVHDLHVAHWLDEVNDSDWDSHGDNLELPINPSSLQNNKLHAFLHFGGHVQGHRIGYAASLQNASGDAHKPCLIVQIL